MAVTLEISYVTWLFVCEVIAVSWWSNQCGRATGHLTCTCTRWWATGCMVRWKDYRPNWVKPNQLTVIVTTQFQTKSLGIRTLKMQRTMTLTPKVWMKWVGTSNLSTEYEYSAHLEWWEKEDLHIPNMDNSNKIHYWIFLTLWNDRFKWKNYKTEVRWSGWVFLLPNSSQNQQNPNQKREFAEQEVSE